MKKFIILFIIALFSFSTDTITAQNKSIINSKVTELNKEIHFFMLLKQEQRIDIQKYFEKYGLLFLYDEDIYSLNW